MAGANRLVVVRIHIGQHKLIPYTMKQIDLIFLPFFFLTLLVLVLVVLWIAKFRKLYENKTEIPGILDDSDLSQEEMGVQFSEYPFIELH
jgi:hypothetical protein